MTLLSCDALRVLRGACPVVDGVGFNIAPGEVVGLIGPNGAGKTTLMRAALGLLPHQGHSSLAALPVRDRARHAAWMPQGRDVVWPMSVGDLVALGAVPTARPDPVTVDRALRRTDLLGHRDRRVTELSGGEQARVLLARALAQDTPLLAADEPVAGLDPAHQIATMDVFRALAAEGRSVLVSLHDLGLAARHCDRIIVLQRGRKHADGAPRDVLTPALMAEVFGVIVWQGDTDQGWVMQPMSEVRRR